MSLLLALVVLIVFFLLSAALVVLVVGPLILLQPMRRTKKWYEQFTSVLEPHDAGIPQEDVTLETSEGHLLRGWLVAQTKRKAKGTVIYLHGVGDCKTAGVQLSRLLFRRGFNVFLYDSRAHGESGGAYCTYGYYEKYDVSIAINYLLKRREIRVGKLGVFGTSMGAAVAVQAAAIDDRIKAVVAEACFTDLRTIAVDYQRRIIKLPWHFLRNVALSRSQTIARFKAHEVSPLLDIQKLRIPVLFIHGTEDQLINYEYSKKLYHHANEPKEIVLVPGANHTDVWEISGFAYERKVISFFTQHLR
ncbi:MAG: alpha/beta fold hydrolase [Ignavibacteriales bacterium]|nr:alpha/beta fold hydrolase [Ignavibacteriales bacterium]